MTPLILFVGKSGTGKNYLSDILNLKSIPSYTTRPMRYGEVDGREHYFVSKEFWNGFDGTLVAAYTSFNGYQYWTSVNQLENEEYNAYIIDTNGLDYLFSLKKQGRIKRDFVIFEIRCPWYVRLSRMIARGDGIKKSIKRFFHDIKAFSNMNSILKEYNFNKRIIIENR